MSSLSRFPVKTIAAIEIALSAGYFYNDDLLPFVFKTLRHGECKFVMAGVVEMDAKSDGFVEAHEKVVSDLCVEVAKLPRGHYMVLKIAQGHGKFWYKTVVSDGFSDRIARPTGEGYDTMPHADDVRVLFIKREIYKCRQAVDAARAVAKNLAAIKAHGLHAGYVHTGTFVQYVHAVHCNVTICEISEGNLFVRMKREAGAVAGGEGTGFKWRAAEHFEFKWIGAADFVKRAALDIVPAAKVVTYACQLDLFAA